MLDLQGERLARACAFAQLLEKELRSIPEHFMGEEARVYVYMMQLRKDLNAVKKLYCSRKEIGIVNFENIVGQWAHVHKDLNSDEGSE